MEESNFVNFKVKLLMRTKSFCDICTEFRLSYGIPESGFKKINDFNHWNKNNEGVLEERVSFLMSKYDLSYNYKEFVEDFITLGPIDSLEQYAEKIHIYGGNQALMQQKEDYNRIFIEIFPETTINDIKVYFEKQRNLAGRHNIDSLRSLIFKKLPTKYKIFKKELIALRLYELKEAGMKGPDVADHLNEEFGLRGKAYFTYTEVNLQYHHIKKLIFQGKKDSV